MCDVHLCVCETSAPSHENHKIEIKKKRKNVPSSHTTHNRKPKTHIHTYALRCSIILFDSKCKIKNCVVEHDSGNWQAIVAIFAAVATSAATTVATTTITIVRVPSSSSVVCLVFGGFNFSSSYESTVVADAIVRHKQIDE